MKRVSAYATVDQHYGYRGPYFPDILEFIIELNPELLSVLGCARVNVKPWNTLVRFLNWCSTPTEQRGAMKVLCQYRYATCLALASS